MTEDESKHIFHRLEGLEARLERRAEPQLRNPSSKNGNGAKAFGSALAILAIIGGMAAIVRPMQQQMDAMARDIHVHQTSSAHPEATASLAGLKEKFAEVETQFRALRELVDTRQEGVDGRLDGIQDWLSWWHKTVPGLDAVQNTKIEALEREHQWATPSSSSRP